MPYKDKERQLQASREWKEKHWYQDTLTKKRYYLDNQDKLIQYQRDFRERMKESNRCTSCAIPLIEGESVSCVNCTATNRIVRGVLYATIN